MKFGLQIAVMIEIIFVNSTPKIRESRKRRRRRPLVSTVINFTFLVFLKFMFEAMSIVNFSY